MTTEYHVKLIQTGNTQTLTIPQDLTLSTTDVTIRQEDGKLIIEPYHKKSLLSVLATNAGLVATMAQVAEALAERGDENAAQFLMGMANQLGELLGLSASTATPKTQLDFLLEVLQATSDSRHNPRVVYPLLQKNLPLLDDNFARILYDWGTAKLAEVEAEQAQAIAAVIGEFSNLIQQFPLGSQATNLEIH